MAKQRRTRNVFYYNGAMYLFSWRDRPAVVVQGTISGDGQKWL